jgi:hypothetical protein
MKYIILTNKELNLGSATKNLNVALIKYDGIPLIEHALRSREDSYVIGVGRNKSTLVEYLEITHAGWDIEYVDINEKFSSLDSVFLCLRNVNEPFVIIPINSIYDYQDWEHSDKNILVVGEDTLCDVNYSLKLGTKKTIQPPGYYGYKYTGLMRVKNYKEFKRYMQQKRFTDEHYFQVFTSLRTSKILKLCGIIEPKYSSDFERNTTDIKYNDTSQSATFIKGDIVVKYNKDTQAIKDLKIILNT